MNERFLILSADDYGMTRPGNEAVQQLFRAGRITSAGVLAPARLAKEACACAVEMGLPIGVHWTIHAEWPGEAWLPSAGAERVPSLCQDGALKPDSASASLSAKGADVTRELDAQRAYLTASGAIPDHADSHGGTLYGINGRLLFINAFKLCRRYGLPFRFPRRPDFLRRQFGKEPGSALKAAHRAIVLLADAMGVRLVDDFITHPDPVERIGGYEDLRSYYDRELRNAKPGITEVFMHPSLPDEALEKLTPQWRKRVWEYQYLMSEEFMGLIRREGFRLCSWGSAPFKGSGRDKG